MRVSAKELTSLILDEERLRAERQDRKSWKSRVTGIEEFGPHHSGPSDPQRQRHREVRARRQDEDDLEYRLAIEASKNEAEEDAKRRAKGTKGGDDDDLAKAIKLSKEEEELRRKELEETNASSLFDDTPSQSTQMPQPTGFNQGYQQQGAVDWDGNLVGQQQPQSTGFLNNAYAQYTGAQGQQTGFQNGYGFQQQQQQQPQQTGYDQFGQQSFMQPQQTSFNMNNPYQQQANGGLDAFSQQQQQQQQMQQMQMQQYQQSPIEQQSTLQPGTQNPWAMSQSGQSDLAPQATGSNNPFASSFTRPQPAPHASAPTLGTLHEQKAQIQFNNTSFNPPVSFSTPQPQQAQPQIPQQQQQQPPKEQDPHHAHLNHLLATGEGQDTFGNTGNLRIPAQHTAPGTFVNSAGAGLSRINPAQTGNNPFLSSQFTGVPQSTGFGNAPGGGAGGGIGAQGRMMPAQTGPAGGFGAGGSNPFGAGRGGQGAGQGSLIDL